MTNTRSIPAGQFKTHCLALLDEVQASGEEIIVTKRGKPVARIVPARKEEWASLVGTVVYQEGDLDEPLGVEWEAAN